MRINLTFVALSFIWTVVSLRTCFTTTGLRIGANLSKVIVTAYS